MHIIGPLIYLFLICFPLSRWNGNLGAGNGWAIIWDGNRGDGKGW